MNKINDKLVSLLAIGVASIIAVSTTLATQLSDKAKQFLAAYVRHKEFRFEPPPPSREEHHHEHEP
jgi:hypothetical protein